MLRNKLAPNHGQLLTLMRRTTPPCFIALNDFTLTEEVDRWIFGACLPVWENVGIFGAVPRDPRQKKKKETNGGG